jgi:hypothetical protein
MRRMKAIPGRLRGLVVIAALGTGLTAAAQSIQFFTIQKVQGFTQTDTATVAANNDAAHDSYPWRFEANINGTSLDPSHPPSLTHVTTPGGSGVPAFDLSFLPVYGWEYRPGYGSQGAMDADLTNGSYSVLLGTPGATSFTLNLAGDYYPNNPLAVLTGGNWVGGVYQLDPANAWSIGSGTFTFNVGAANSRIEIAIGTAVGFDKAAGFGTGTPFTGPSGSLSVASTDSGAPTFLAGNFYNVDIRFISGTDSKDITANLNGAYLSGPATAVAFYDSQLSFTIQAIPEPATYAAWAGLLGLAAAVIRRRFMMVS